MPANKAKGERSKEKRKKKGREKRKELTKLEIVLGQKF